MARAVGAANTRISDHQFRRPSPSRPSGPGVGAPGGGAGSDGDLVVIDYKSDDVGEPGVDALLERYQWRGAAYAAALESATGKTVNEVQFLFVRLDDPLRRVANLQGLMAKLPDRIANVV